MDFATHPDITVQKLSLGREGEPLLLIDNLLADAEATRGYFIAECMGRSAGWLAYGAAIAGEASLVLSVEDVEAKMATEETVTDPKTGVSSVRKIMDMEKLVNTIVGAMLVFFGWQFGVVN